MPASSRPASNAAWVGIGLSAVAMLFGAVNWQRQEDLGDIDYRLGQQQRATTELRTEVREDLKELRAIILAGSCGGP